MRRDMQSVPTGIINIIHSVIFCEPKTSSQLTQKTIKLLLGIGDDDDGKDDDDVDDADDI